jgi:hypothetical protein
VNLLNVVGVLVKPTSTRHTLAEYTQDKLLLTYSLRSSMGPGWPHLAQLCQVQTLLPTLQGTKARQTMHESGQWGGSVPR